MTIIATIAIVFLILLWVHTQTRVWEAQAALRLKGHNFAEALGREDELAIENQSLTDDTDDLRGEILDLLMDNDELACVNRRQATLILVLEESRFRALTARLN